MSIDVKAVTAEAEALLRGMPEVLKFHLIGSAMYMPEPRDVDFVVLIDAAHNAVDFTTDLHHEEWGICGEYEGEEGIWAAIRKGPINLIVTHDAPFYEKYVVGMEVCKALKLEHREDRVAVCQIVRDGMTADQVMTYAKTQEAHKAAMADLDALLGELS